MQQKRMVLYILAALLTTLAMRTENTYAQIPKRVNSRSLLMSKMSERGLVSIYDSLHAQRYHTYIHTYIHTPSSSQSGKA